MKMADTPAVVRRNRPGTKFEVFNNKTNTNNPNFHLSRL